MLNMDAHSYDTFISLCLWYAVFLLLFLALSLGTSSLTQFLLPKWFKTFLTSTEIILNKTKSFLLKYQVSPVLKPSRNPCCFTTAWLSQPINWGLSSFTCTWLAGLSLECPKHKALWSFIHSPPSALALFPKLSFATEALQIPLILPDLT